MENKIKVGDVFKSFVTRFGKEGDPLVIKEGKIIILKDIGKIGIKLNNPIKIKIEKVFPKFCFGKVVL